jgi:hypothetical protein
VRISDVVIESPPTTLDPPEMSKEELRELFKNDPYLPGPHFIHDCEECVFLGAINPDAVITDDFGNVTQLEKWDFYYCDKSGYRTYICRYGNEGHEYNSYPLNMLKDVPPYSADISILKEEYNLHNAKHKSEKFKLYIYVDPVTPDKINLFGSSLTTARYKKVVESLLPHIWDRFGFQNATEQMFCEMMRFIETALTSWYEDPSSYFPRR